MKKLFALLLLPLSFYAQNDSIQTVKPNLSLISLNHLNVVYRGIYNPISLAVKDSKPYKIKGDALTQDENGLYKIKPKFGNTTKVLVEIETSDSTKVYEEHTFKIKDLPSAVLLVNQKGCINSDCTLEIPNKELLNAEITIKLIDFLIDYNITVTSFRLYLTNESGDTLASFDVQGNKISKEIYEEISNNKKGTLIIIHKITFTSNLNLSIAKTPMIKIRKIISNPKI